MTLLDTYLDDAAALEAVGEYEVADSVFDMALAIEEAGITHEDDLIEGLLATGFLVTAEEAFASIA